MIIPSSFQAAYSGEQAILEQVQEVAESRLRALCERERWLFADRMKTAESVLARLQLGDVDSLGDIADFYAATVIVPTRNQLDAATTAVVDLFADTETRSERNTDPLSFPYDDIHVTAQLGASATRPSDPSRSRRFEIQVRTGLQYAWWWATHDVIYKGGVQDWRAHRLASEIRASLELLDDLLADIEGASKLQPSRTTTAEDVHGLLADLLEEWPTEQRPSDVRRFCETALLYGEAANVDVNSIVNEIRQAGNTDVRGIPGITPAQAVFIALYRREGEPMVEALTSAGRRVFTSPEMLEACPELSAVDAAACVGVD